MNLPSIPKSFFNGDCFDAYRILGAHPCTAPDGAEGWRFAGWIPVTQRAGGFIETIDLVFERETAEKE